MRHAAAELRAVVADIIRAIDVEGALLLGGAGVLAGVAWTFEGAPVASTIPKDPSQRR